MSGVLILAVTFAAWRLNPRFPLALLYLIPVTISAASLPRYLVASLAVVCTGLAEAFTSLEPSYARMMFEALALAGCGLFVGEFLRNRRLHLRCHQMMRALAETSPASILVVNERGLIELANRGALELLAPHRGLLVGEPIAAFLPQIHHSLRWEEAPQCRASLQCRGRKGSGESFTAEVWFSTFKDRLTPGVAAIVAGLSEERNSTLVYRERPKLNCKEEEVLNLSVQGLTNKEIAARMETSESSVKNSMQQIFAKTGVRTRSQLVRIALEEPRNGLYPCGGNKYQSPAIG